MPIIASESGGDFKPASAGPAQGVCVDVVDLGVIASKNFVDKNGNPQKSHKVRIVWEINELREDGKPFTVGKQYTLSLGEKANLRKELESWRGKAFTVDELKGFDLEKLIGANAFLNIMHDETGKWANVHTIMQLMKGATKIQPSAGYVRVKDRKPEDQPQDHEAPPVEDDDIPF